MKKIFVLFFVSTTLLLLPSCSDDTISELEDEIDELEEIEEEEEIIIDNTIAFYDEDVTAEWKELFEGGYKARATGTIISLEEISSVEYKIKANVTLENKNYDLEATFNPYEERAPIIINGEESEGYLSVYSCTDCSANLRVNLNRTFAVNSLNYIRFNITFSSDL